MKLVEVIPAIQTSSQVLATSQTTIENWKKVVAVAKDTPGFIVNRVARPFYGEALRIYEEGIADFATIDHAVKSVGGFKMGPFQLKRSHLKPTHTFYSMVYGCKICDTLFIYSKGLSVKRSGYSIYNKPRSILSYSNYFFPVFNSGL